MPLCTIPSYQKLLPRFPIANIVYRIYTRSHQRTAPVCNPNSHIPATRDFYYRLSSPLYIDAIGQITAITNVPIINAINKIIIGSIAASTLWVVISTSSS